ncbi:hypothetical protein Tco_0706462 [Tanacetum coccineum]|uniref:Synaptobrevin, longin-like domain protein n=1 Tax=Tanacetum coccineum TaxID=301880 RepID=A0ABQ4Y932_9ASTR
MSALKFADSYNMVAFLAKPTESDGFKQILDFLNANPIKYGLTVNLTIYTSCIEQFWATTKVKTVNGEVQLQAIVDGKKVIVTEISVRRDLQLEDAEGIECLPNADIFEQFFLMGYEKPSQKLTFYKAFFSPQWKFLIHTILQCLSAKSTAWNEFSSTMASTIICLATNQKFNFSKYIFESMVKNVDSSVKFLMYPRFVQVFLDKQVGDMSTHDEIFVTPSHTKKVFGNMKRVGKGFSRAVTPLFPTMMVQAQEEMGEEPVADEAVYEERGDSVERAATTTSSLKVEQDSGGRPRRQETMGDRPAQTRFESLSKQSNDPPLSRVNTLGSGEDRLKLKELMDLCTKLFDRVLALETTKTAQAKEIASLKKRVKKLERKRKSKTPGMKRLFKIGTTEEITLAQALAELRSAKPKVVLQAEEEEQARLAREKAKKVKEANISWDNVQAMIEADRLLAERLQAREQEELTDAKKARLEDCKRKGIDAIPLATKPAVIVDYKIYRKGKQGYYEIMRADGSSKIYLLFSQLIKSFDREDLETLWKLVKAKHGNTRPEEGYERVLWGDLKTMFEHHVEDLIWRNLQGKKVLLWRLYDSCGIHFVRFEDMHVYMLVEKRYPLTPATITDMLNKKLKSDYWNEMCYQLLKLMTKQLKKQ